MKKNRKRKSKFTKLERFLYKSSLAIAVSLFMGIVFTSVSMAKMNIEIQKMDKVVKSQEDTNQSLTMKINEMASLENIQTVSKNLGLSYNNGNIKTIE